jgi:hypothetical protein
MILSDTKLVNNINKVNFAGFFVAGGAAKRQGESGGKLPLPKEHDSP